MNSGYDIYLVFGVVFLVVTLMHVIPKLAAFEKKRERIATKERREEELHQAKLANLRNATSGNKSGQGRKATNRNGARGEGNRSHGTKQQSYQRNDSGVKGILIKHGPAKYKFKKDENPSYFATLEANGKEITLWGVGLKSALYRVELGSEVELSRGKKERVEVDARQYDVKGQFVGIEKMSTYRQSWSCDIVST
jgi:putative DNA primase/helicase